MTGELKSRSKTTLRARLLLVAYAAAIGLLALFALTAIRLPALDFNQTNAQGTNYQGVRDVVSGDFVGTINITFASGAHYKGAVEESGFSGQATYTGATGWTISGVFTSGYLEGEGTYNDNLGTYEGYFVHSVPDGKGIYISVQGWRYEGDFKTGVITGQGTLTLTSGTVLEGAFIDGVFQGSQG